MDVGFIAGHYPGGFSQFKKILSAIHSIAGRFDKIGRDATLPGVITYGEAAGVSIPLGGITSRSDLSKIMKIIMPAEGENIKGALRRAANNFFYPSSSSGARSGAAKTIYLFIDSSRASKLDIKDELQNLKQSGVKVITIAYGGASVGEGNTDPNADDVRDVTSPSDNWFFPEDLNSLLTDDNGAVTGDDNDAGGNGLLRSLATSALPGMCLSFFSVQMLLYKVIHQSRVCLPSLKKRLGLCLSCQLLRYINTN